MLSTEDSCWPQNKTLPISFTWKVTNFSQRLNSGCSLGSSFPCPHDSKRNWCLRINPENTFEAENAEYFSLRLNCLLFNRVVDNEDEAIIQMSILNAENQRIYIACEPQLLSHVNDYVRVWKWDNFIEKSELLDATTEVLINDTLILFCEIYFPRKPQCEAESEVILPLNNSFHLNSPEKDPENTLVPAFKSRLQSDMYALLKNELFSDVILIAGGKEFKVHRNILAGRSSVFAAMFSTKSTEKRELIMEIDVDRHVFSKLLYYIYTGESPDFDSAEMTSDVLIAAAKYNLEELKGICETDISGKLNVNNVLKTLELADLHRCYQLKLSVMEFIHGHGAALTGTTEWKILVRDNPRLLAEAFEHHIAQNAKECTLELNKDQLHGSAVVPL